MNLLSNSKDKDKKDVLSTDTNPAETSFYPWALLKVLLLSLLFSTLIFPAQVAHDDLARILARTIEMMEQDTWLSGGPLYSSTPICPPLLYWLTACATLLFGTHSAYAPLLVSILSSIIILLSMYRSIKSVNTVKQANIFWALFGGSFVFLFYARFLSVSLLYTLIAVLFLNTFARWQRRNYSGVPFLLFLYAALLGLSAGLPGQLIVLSTASIWSLCLDLKRGTLLLRPAGIILFSILVSGAWYASVAGALGSGPAAHMFFSPQLSLKSFALTNPFIVIALGFCPWLFFLLPRLISTITQLPSRSLPNSKSVSQAIKALKPDSEAKEYSLLCLLFLILLLPGMLISHTLSQLLFASLPFLYALLSNCHYSRGEEHSGNYIYPILSIGFTTLVVLLCLLILFGIGGRIELFVAMQRGVVNNTNATTVLLLPLLAMILLSVLQTYRVFVRRNTLRFSSASSILGVQYVLLLIILFNILIPISRQWHQLLPFIGSIPVDQRVQIFAQPGQHLVLRGLLNRPQTIRETIESVSASEPVILSEADYSEHALALQGIYGQAVELQRYHPEKDGEPTLLLFGSPQVQPPAHQVEDSDTHSVEDEVNGGSTL